MWTRTVGYGREGSSEQFSCSLSVLLCSSFIAFSRPLLSLLHWWQNLDEVCARNLWLCDLCNESVAAFGHVCDGLLSSAELSVCALFWNRCFFCNLCRSWRAQDRSLNCARVHIRIRLTTRLPLLHSGTYLYHFQGSYCKGRRVLLRKNAFEDMTWPRSQGVSRFSYHCGSPLFGTRLSLEVVDESLALYRHLIDVFMDFGPFTGNHFQRIKLFRLVTLGATRE